MGGPRVVVTVRVDGAASATAAPLPSPRAGAARLHFAGFSTGPTGFAVNTAGASRTSVLLKAYWPQVQPSFWSLALFRWDINVRESAVLGLVGAGGIGVALEAAISDLYWDQVGLCLLVIFGVVIVTSAIRSRII